MSYLLKPVMTPDWALDGMLYATVGALVCLIVLAGTWCLIEGVALVRDLRLAILLRRAKRT